MKRWKLFRNRRSRSRGQALVEFALSIAVLAFLLLGVVEFGMTLYTYIVVVDATDEAAAYAAMYPFERDLGPGCPPPCRQNNDPDIAERVLISSEGGGNAIIDPSRFVTVTVTPNYLERDPCARVTVYSVYRHTFFTPLFFGASIDLHYQASKMIVPEGALGLCPP